jgi:hypothetical protein
MHTGEAPARRRRGAGGRRWLGGRKGENHARRRARSLSPAVGPPGHAGGAGRLPVGPVEVEGVREARTAGPRRGGVERGAWVGVGRLKWSLAARCEGRGGGSVG